MRVSIVIPALLNKQSLFVMTKELLDSIFYKTNNINNVEVILVDDGSRTKYPDFLQKFYKQLIVVRNSENLGFAKAVNAGIRRSTADTILILNNDVIIKERGWLNNLINGMEYFKYDIAAPKQSILDETYQYIPDAKRHKYREERCFSYLVGWCLLVKREVFEKVGLFPTNFGIGFWEDTAWSYVIRNMYPNYKMGVVEHIYPAQIEHLEHQTFRSENIDLLKQYTKNREIFMQCIRGKGNLCLPSLEKKGS